ncbi:hypothetical protein OHB41_00875 [Streptomyces sp. NBC_01571]|uniref:hypothetical protein n=1 Tax=Streptomyces sp. NBC_01571 TaxID=2975883 RepID=UPI0022590061|nr:hypothetical protein [Streptomyces sp. NBC_01571]MCX4571783.1 hypothetical protein [Streptomyces sp. NBC_01571]
MTRPETACALGATILTAGGTATAIHHLWWETGVFGALALFLAEGVLRRRRARHGRERRARVQAERAELAARGPAPLPVPCCRIWKSSEGAVHGADCTRPQAARTTLRDAEQRILDQLDDDTRDTA